VDTVKVLSCQCYHSSLCPSQVSHAEDVSTVYGMTLADIGMVSDGEEDVQVDAGGDEKLQAFVRKCGHRRCWL
jgi:hypothetical protein